MEFGALQKPGPLREARSSRREEARFVGCWPSGDFKDDEEALGERSEAGNEGGGVSRGYQLEQR
jgi:hypothetical protein